MNHFFNRQMTYAIQPGDNVWSLARQFRTTPEEIWAYNPWINPNQLHLGTYIYTDSC